MVLFRTTYQYPRNKQLIYHMFMNEQIERTVTDDSHLHKSQIEGSISNGQKLSGLSSHVMQSHLLSSFS